MKTSSKIALASPAVIGAMALSLMAAGPADAQSRYRDRDRDRNNDRTEDVLIGAAVGALAGAIIGDGDSSYVVGGALAGAALGAGFPIIGVGGVMSGTDAASKLKAGADLVQHLAAEHDCV